jgi:UDP-GlcNAc:undecaprenyl-phosphate GlcNAc-1-phosphate transferase
VIPILILGLPMLDTLRVMVGRLARRQSPFQADRTHLHHRLLACGLTQYEAVSLTYSAQFLLVVLAYLLRYSADSAILIVYALFCAGVLAGVKLLERHHEHLRSREEHETSLARLRRKARGMGLFTKVPLLVLSTVVPLVLVLGAFSVPFVPRDIGFLAALLLAVLLAVLLARPLPFVLVERIAAYVTAVAVTYLIEQSGGPVDLCAWCVHLVYGFLAIVVAVWVRFSSERFAVSTLDLLILLMVLIAPAMSGFGLRDLGVVALESVVLFYGIEVLLQERERRWDPLRMGIIAALAVLAAKALLPG